MNAMVAIIPFLFIRFVLLGRFGRKNLERAAVFAPRAGLEKTAYGVYQLSTFLLLLGPSFLTIRTQSPWFQTGLLVLILGSVLLARAVTDFARPDEKGFNARGLYRISRNPMYVAYFVCFSGVVILTRSILLFAVLVIFQGSAHGIIRSEERWCIGRFGQEYIEYMKKVRRYI